MKEQHIRIIPIIDAAVKEEKGYPVYDEGIEISGVLGVSVPAYVGNRRDDAERPAFYEVDFLTTGIILQDDAVLIDEFAVFLRAIENDGIVSPDTIARIIEFLDASVVLWEPDIQVLMTTLFLEWFFIDTVFILPFEDEADEIPKEDFTKRKGVLGGFVQKEVTFLLEQLQRLRISILAHG